MADSKVSALTSKATPTVNDLLHIVDVADTTDGLAGTSKKATLGSLPFLRESSKIVAPSSSGYTADYYTTGTNDHTLINSALSAVSSAGGGFVFLKAGSYTIGGTILIPSNCALIGEGRNATIITKVASGSFDAVTNLDTTNGNSHILIRDFKVNGNNTNGALGRGVNFVKSSNILAERIYLIDAVEGFKTDTCTDVIFEKCIGDGNYEWNFYQYGGKRVKVLNCQSLNAKHLNFEGFGIAFYQNCTYCEAIGNYVFNSAHNGIQVNAGSATANNVGQIVRDNIVINAGNYGIMVTDDAGSFHVQYASIANNRVTGSVSKGINIVDTLDSSISGNKSFTNTANDGITYDTCTNIYSSNNESFGNNVGLRTLGSTNVITSDIITGNTTNFVLDSGTITLGPGDLIIDGQAARTLSLTREATASTVGQSLTVQAGGATSGGTDLNGGTLTLAAGIATGNNASTLQFQAVPNGQGTGTTDRSPLTLMFLTGTGTNNTRARLALGTNGAGSADGITFSGNSQYQVAMNRQTNATTTGGVLFLQSSGAKSASSNTKAGAVQIATGIGTGNAVPALIQLQATPLNASSGTGDNAIIDKMIINATKVLTNASPINLVNCTVASNTVIGGIIKYAIEVFDGTNLQMETGEMTFQLANKGGVFSGNTITQIGSAKQFLGSGTLSITWAISAANPGVISLNANSSLTPTTGYPRITYTIENLTQQAIAIQ